MELGVTGTPTLFASKGGGRATRIARWGEFAGVQEVVDRLMSEGEGN
jgi:hypothetical protein